MPRQKSITPEVAQYLLKVRTQGATVRQACAMCGISPTTYYAYIKENPKWEELVNDLQGSLRYAAEVLLRDAIIEEKSISIAQWFLRHRHSDVYNTKGDANVNTDDSTVSLRSLLTEVTSPPLQEDS